MNKINIIIIGGGGHGLSVADVIMDNPLYNLIGYIDNKRNSVLGKQGIPYIGDDKAIISGSAAVAAHIGVGQIKSPARRMALFDAAKQAGFELPHIISKHAYVSPLAKIGEGTLVMHKAAVNACATIGKNCIINTAAVVEHGVTIGCHCHIAPGATVLGDVRIGEGSFIGAGAIVCEGLSIGNEVVIGAGAVIRRDVGDGITIRGSDLR